MTETLFQEKHRKIRKRAGGNFNPSDDSWTVLQSQNNISDEEKADWVAFFTAIEAIGAGDRSQRAAREAAKTKLQAIT